MNDTTYAGVAAARPARPAPRAGSCPVSVLGLPERQRRDRRRVGAQDAGAERDDAGLRHVAQPGALGIGKAALGAHQHGCRGRGAGKRRGAAAGLFWDPTYTSTGGIRAGVQPHDGGSTSSSSGDEYDLMMGSGGVKQQRSNRSRGNAAGKARDVGCSLLLPLSLQPLTGLLS